MIHFEVDKAGKISYHRMRRSATVLSSRNTQPPNNTMKIRYITMALLAGSSVICSSCVVPASGYATYTSPGGQISTGVAWTNASYDADGFPIFGYSYGRPVYGYTASGAAIFTIAALTALCFVPHWSPATWYHGHYHYPVGIHRCAAPPRFPSGHRPAVRPPSGIKPPAAPAHRAPAPAPAHRAPAAKVQPPRAAAPAHRAPAAKVQPPRAAAPAHRAAAPAQHNSASHNRHVGASAPKHTGTAAHGSNSSFRTLPAPAGGRPVASVPSSFGSSHRSPGSVQTPSIGRGMSGAGRSFSSGGGHSFGGRGKR